MPMFIENHAGVKCNILRRASRSSLDDRFNEAFVHGLERVCSSEEGVSGMFVGVSGSLISAISSFDIP